MDWGCVFMHLVEAIFCYLFGFILNSEDCFYHKYIRAVLWEAKFKAVYCMQYRFYQYCFPVRILGIDLTREVLVGTRIHVCSSNSASLFKR
jgi:hypothetical protein